MTIDHHAEAVRYLSESHDYHPLDLAHAHATLAIIGRLDDIHDALTAKPCDCAKQDAYAAREAEQREADDPLDEDDHRDRIARDGGRWLRCSEGRWHYYYRAVHAGQDCNARTLRVVYDAYGPLTFAPDTAPQATGDDLTASGAEGGPVEGSVADDAQEAILCPECDDHINTHNVAGCRYILCDCPRTPQDVTRALIAEAVKAERGKLAGELREVAGNAQSGGLMFTLQAKAARWEGK